MKDPVATATAAELLSAPAAKSPAETRAPQITTAEPRTVRSIAGALLRYLYRYVPLPSSAKRGVKGIVFRASGPLLANTVAYRAWVDQAKRLREERERIDDTGVKLALQDYVGRSGPARASAVHLQIDSPLAGLELDDVLIVSGWAFSRGAGIARVDAWLHERYLGPVQYGTSRPDVRVSHPWVSREECGFFDVLPLPRGVGPATVHIRAVDRAGAWSEAAVVVRQAPWARSLLTIDRAQRTGTELFIEGWAMGPPAEAPLHVRLVTRGTEVGLTRVHLSRTDVWTSLPGYCQASRSGFRLRCPVPASGLLSMDTADRAGRPSVELELVGKTGRLLSEPVVFRASDGIQGSLECAAWTRLLTEHRQHTGERPSVLDWSNRPELAPESPDAIAFTPVDARAHRLPYIDGSVDFVIVSDDIADGLAEARRVARAGVIRVLKEDPRAVGRARRIEVDWLDRPLVRPLPSASVIIPTFNAATILRACLEQLQRTVPANLTVEVIVVDDASTDGTGSVVREIANRDARVRYVRNDVNQRFLRSINRGATLAQHDVLVFLNNDTVPQSGWLEPLLELLRDRADAGAVGAKLVYPDGALQEAGGVIFDDGSGWNFGRGAVDPEHPLYDRVREVDYCSGAALATWRSLFLEDGGFDERYAPMYYEDTDYCFELRRRGRRVYYQPASVIVHLEGYSAGTDATQGIKAYQTRNREIFRAKWTDALREQPPVPLVADRAAEYRLADRQPERVRRVLVCAPLMPEFDRESGSKRIYDLLMMLCDSGWQVSFYAQGAGVWSWRYVRLLQQRGVIVYVGHQAQWMGDLFTWNRHELVELGQFDLAIVAFWHLAERFAGVIRSLSPHTRVIVDSIDLHFLREMRRMLNDPSVAELPSEGTYLGELAREINTYRSADAVFAVSEKEAGLIDEFAGYTRHAVTVGDAERAPDAVRSFDERRGILLLGSFRHRPNLEAAELFLSEILPRLDRRLLHDHPIFIVGTDLERTRLLGTVRDPLVRLVGWVPAVEPYLERCRITILPLRHGAGTKRKLIQALMHGAPSVSTAVGTEGLGLVDGEHVLVANAPAVFARAMERLLTDRALWERLSEQGRRHAIAGHGYDQVSLALERAIDEVMARPVRQAQPPVSGSPPDPGR